MVGEMLDRVMSLALSSEPPISTFYTQLPVLNQLIEISNPHHFMPVPADWSLVITDIKGSTQAIEAGRHRDVNLVAACGIVSILNLCRALDPTIEVPFVFGGDGAVLLIPPALVESTKAVLWATQAMAQAQLGFDLRVGVIPMQEILAAHYQIQVAKLRVTPTYAQAIFTGGGLAYADYLLKSPAGQRYQLNPQTLPSIEADYFGLECRWQDIPPPSGEILSLLVVATSPDPEQHPQIYRDVLATLDRLFGDSCQRHPVSPNQLQLTFKNERFLTEAKIHCSQQSIWQKWAYAIGAKLENIMGWFFMRFKIKIQQLDWGFYKNEVVAATDFEKFDDALRMVIKGSQYQRLELQAYLEKRYQQGELAYGIHVSDRVLMTCMVFERQGNHVHFVDGADGGYAFAAKDLKARLKQLHPDPSNHN